MRLETERLLLRPLAIEDLDDFLALSEDTEAARFVSVFDRPEAERRLEANEREWEERGHGLLAIHDLDSNAFLGRTGLKHWPRFDETEVGWILLRQAWGHGYATEAARACIEWGFASLDIPYLTAMIMPANERSIRVADRLGFSPLRNDVLLDEPVIVYALYPPGPD